MPFSVRLEDPRWRLAAAATVGGFFLLTVARGGKVVPVLLAVHGALLLAGGALLARSPLPRPLTVSLLGVALLQILSASVSGCVEGSLLTLSRFWAPLAFALLSREIWGGRSWRVFNTFLIGGAALQAILIAAARLTGAPLVMLLPGNPQYGALWMVMAFFIVLDSPGWTSFARAAAAALISSGILFSLTRSAVLAWAAGGMYLLYRRFGARGILWSVAGLAGGLAAIPRSWAEAYLKVSDPAAWKRWDIWRSGIGGILDRPWLGWGPGQFEGLYRLHMVPQETSPLRFDHSTLFAHNDYLQLAGASGLPAFLCLLAVLAIFWRWRLKERPAASSAVLSTGVFCLFNFPFALPAVGLAAGGLLGSLAPPPSGAGQGPRAAGRILSALLLGLGFFTVSRLPFFWKAGPPERLFYGRPSLSLCTSRAENWEVEAWALAERGDLEGALTFMREALRRHPKNAAWWTTAGLWEEALGRPESAAEAFHRSLRIEPSGRAAAFHLGRMISSRGETARARAWLRRLEALPSIDVEAASPYARAVLSLPRKR